MASNDKGGQEHASRRSDEATDEAAGTAPADEATSGVRERHEKLGDDVDALLDEIDDVLEENAEEFVRGYVQKGGE